MEIAAVAVTVGAVREASRAPRGRSGARTAASWATTARTWRRHAAATFPCSGRSLVTFGGPWIDKQTVVEAVNDQAGSVTQDHRAGARREGGAAEPLVGLCSPLVARGR